MIEATGSRTFSARSRCCRVKTSAQCSYLPKSTGNAIMIIMELLLPPLIVMNLLFTSSSIAGHRPILYAEAVSVQRLNVPDLVVIGQLNNNNINHLQQQQQESQATKPQGRSAFELRSPQNRTQSFNSNGNNQPEAASLINSQDLNDGGQQQSQITFECLISFDRGKDKNLVVKWHHDDRIEPIYQWIPELNKRSIAAQYRANIAPIVPTSGSGIGDLFGQNQSAGSGNSSANPNQIQLLQAGFRLVRPNKELGGKYTCSAISTQNDDSKWKKMIVYTPPLTFRFNASRTDIGAQLASQRERLIQLTQPAILGGPSAAMTAGSHSSSSAPNQLPLVYRMRGFESQLNPMGPTTISPQMYSTIDYVNVNQQRARQSALQSSMWLVGQPTSSPNAIMSSTSSSSFSPSSDSAQRQHIGSQLPAGSGGQIKQNGVKLVCDIDQVFPVPEVNIYRLAKLDGSHPDKLAKLDTRIERNLSTGLFRVQVISIVEDEELQMKYGPNEPVYFECMIALTNLELSKYADNKRSLVYRPDLLTSSSSPQDIQTSEDITLEQAGNGAGFNVPNESLSILSALILVVYLSAKAVHPSSIVLR